VPPPGKAKHTADRDPGKAHAGEISTATSRGAKYRLAHRRNPRRAPSLASIVNNSFDNPPILADEQDLRCQQA
jgi:hypothetical protein